MVIKTTEAGKQISRIGAVALLSGLLVACGGGSSGDSTPLGDQDLDGDGTINSEDDDSDDDGIPDTEDLFVDWDQDGLDDLSGLTEEMANTPLVPGDSDGDGFVDVSEDNPCGSDTTGTDNNSSNEAWNDNCEVKRSSVGGQFADSLFSVGIQRVVYCSGHGDASSYIAFADGEYGPGSEAATIAFQTAENILPADGIVGPITWNGLQSKVEELSTGTFTDGTRTDTYGFSEGRCAGIPMFYQVRTLAEDGLSTVGGGWSLARNQPNETEQLPFSIDAPFGRL